MAFNATFNNISVIPWPSLSKMYKKPQYKTQNNLYTHNSVFFPPVYSFQRTIYTSV